MWKQFRLDNCHLLSNFLIFDCRVPTDSCSSNRTILGLADAVETILVMKPLTAPDNKIRNYNLNIVKRMSWQIHSAHRACPRISRLYPQHRSAMFAVLSTCGSLMWGSPTSSTRNPCDIVRRSTNRFIPTNCRGQAFLWGLPSIALLSIPFFAFFTLRSRTSWAFAQDG